MEKRSAEFKLHGILQKSGKWTFYIKIMDLRNRLWRSKILYVPTIILLSLIRIEITRLCGRKWR